MNKGDAFDLEFEVTEKIYVGFIELFNDKNPMHCDDVFAKKKGFPSKIVHGNVLGGYLSYFIGEKLPLKEVVILSQTIKYHKPFFIGDNLNLEAVVTDFFDSVQLVDIKFVFKNQSGLKIAKGTIQVKII